MENLAIIGSGTMGHSIALAAAWAGFNVKVFGVNEEDLARADRGVRSKLQVMEENDLMDRAESADIRSRISLGTSLPETLQGSTFIIEAIPEVLELKHELYREVEELVDEKVIIASNTSGCTPTSLAEKAMHPGRFIVTHFWNPGHLIPLVEVVKGKQTTQDTVDRTMDLMHRMKKEPILLEKEVPGFIGNRLQFALFREAQSLLDEGVASKEDIDAAAKYSIGRRLPVTGPLMSADLGGLDVFAAISEYLFEDLSAEKKPGHWLKHLVQEGKLGDKSGEGFYRWVEEGSRAINAEREQTLIHFLKQDRENQ
ncbi:MAG TPA: 3-hydroxyacyl-CoA dehydrogenase NAD-binding domain-containing protein [Bacillaceae bacterium]